MMRRKAFILAEILTGLMIQAWFIVTLCGAFYLLLTFSSRIQQSNAAQDHGQRVIAYVDARIRNAGLGLWGCGEAKELAGTYLPSLSRLENLHLPVAITSRDEDDFDPYAVPADGIYSGDVLILLYAHRDLNYINNNKLVISLDNGQQSQDITSSTSTEFTLIEGATDGRKTFNDSAFRKDTEQDKANIKNYAVLESSGIPMYLSTGSTKSIKITNPSSVSSLRIYNMSELLNLECERMYTAVSKGQRSLMIKKLGYKSGCVWNNPLPHTGGVLEIFMTLDINQNPPVFDLKVLVNEGKSDTPTPKPSNWPRRYWKTEYAKYKVHVSQASWRLPNLSRITY